MPQLKTHWQLQDEIRKLAREIVPNPESISGRIRLATIIPDEECEGLGRAKWTWDYFQPDAIDGWLKEVFDDEIAQMRRRFDIAVCTD